MKPLLPLVLTLPLAAAPIQADPYANETPAQHDARMAWWREAKFGMFIHWGVYAVPAGTYKGEQIGGIGEWIMRRAQIPVAEYRAFARDFNPVKYQPAEWAQLAADAGMRYMVITSKHHDGFALFPSEATDWDIADATPYGKDLIGPLAAAARDKNLKFGLYYSQAQDWTHPGGAKAGLKEGQGWDEAHKGSFDDYLTKIAGPQTREILTRYKPDVLWWDTPVWMNEARAEPLAALIALRPGLITNNRLGGGYKGDTDTPEQHIPATGIAGRDWETCMTMNGTWGFKSYDHNWKSTETLIRNLVDIVSKGGNYLLNVGPTKEGEIPQPSIERLRQVGKWMKANGEAIYGTQASLFRMLPWGRSTTRHDGGDTVLFLHVFDWPENGYLPVPGLATEPESVRLVPGDQPLEFTATGESVTISVPTDAPDPISSTIAVRIKGKPEIVAPSIPQAPDGTICLGALASEPLTGKLRYESNKKCIGFWTDPEDTISWTVKISRPGNFRIEGNLAGLGATNLRIEGGSAPVTVTTTPTGDYETFKTIALGKIGLAAGKHTLRLVPVAEKWKPVNVRSLKLTPIQ